MLQIPERSGQMVLVLPIFTLAAVALSTLQHDAQLDYYGKRLATCSSDRTVKVFDVVDGSAAGQGTTLKG